ncbi:hypothetical protein EIN_206490 [Entamoeba invadens IP1]|uniref:Ubiquitin-like domain-containing protein n=1 Tax=Entamoeba invadens IP1 TaxID=370355 RepID=A0A0A1U9F8_ENTIV|nr:hypothetical protein EIN_206490 [Entamoeba invadens IP1]ELP91652.1 hypothetical protein EIN_206490 [Entamoeba invadens IP1]|eukprot:XP_004258423.1 hypothetical protein EIN_206490 [Entamoeba invadens IP1]
MMQGITQTVVYQFPTFNYSVPIQPSPTTKIRDVLVSIATHFKIDQNNLEAVYNDIVIPYTLFSELPYPVTNPITIRFVKEVFPVSVEVEGKTELVNVTPLDSVQNVIDMLFPKFGKVRIWLMKNKTKVPITKHTLILTLNILDFSFKTAYFFAAVKKRITVKLYNHSYPYSVDSAMLVWDLKKQICEDFSRDPAAVVLQTDGKIISAAQKLFDVLGSDGSVSIKVARMKGAKIFVEGLGKSYEICVELEKTVEAVVKILHFIDATPLEGIVVVYKGRPLAFSECLTTVGVKEGDVMTLTH